MIKIVPIITSLALGMTLYTGCGNIADNEKNNTRVEKTSQEASSEDYVIYVEDADSEEPIAGASVQICTDAECQMAQSDKDGKAVFRTVPDKYTVHLIKVPDGYEVSDEEFTLTPDRRTETYMIAKNGEGRAQDNVEADQSAATEIKTAYQKTDAVWDCPKSGFEFKVPESFKNYKGQITVADRGQTYCNNGIVRGCMQYLGRTDDQRDISSSDTDTADS